MASSRADKDRHPIQVALFVTCLVDLFRPSAGFAAVRLLEEAGCIVAVPREQTCCGQPMANSGYEYLSQSCNDLFIENFHAFDYIVCPSGSCTLHIKDHLHSDHNSSVASETKSKLFELSEFLTDVIKMENVQAR